MTRARGPAVALATGLFAATAALAGPPGSLREFPAGTIAYWAADPTFMTEATAAADRNKAALEATLAWLICRAADGDPALLSDLLSPGVLQGSPYRLVLLDFQAGATKPRYGETATTSITLLRAVLEVRGQGAAERLEPVLRTHLHGTESTIALSGGARGTAFASPNGAQAGDLAWARVGDAVVVGFGGGALERWLAAEAGQGPWSEHSAQVPTQGTRVLEAWVDLNALRQSAPELFAYGRLGPLAHAWRLANSRSLFLAADAVKVARSTPPRLAVTAAWSARSEPPGTISTRALTRTLASVPEPHSFTRSYTLETAEPLGATVVAALDTFAALAANPERARPAQEQWAHRNQKVLEQTLALTKGALLVFGPEVGGRPHELTAAVPLDTAAAQRDGTAAIDELFSRLRPHVREGGRETWRWADPSPAPLADLTWRLNHDSNALEATWSPPDKR